MKKWFYELRMTNEFKWRDVICVIISVIALVFFNIEMIKNIKILKMYASIGKLCLSEILINASIIYSNYCVFINKNNVVGNKMENSILKEENSNLVEITDNVRCFKHDFNNIIQAIDGYIVLKDMNSLQMYIDSLVDDCNRVNLVDVLNSQLSDNPAIYGLLINKLKIAEIRKIQMNIEILVNLKQFNDKAYLISRMLGILLDNALEASNECKQKVINIQFSKAKNKNLIIIENTYDNKNIDINKIFEKEYSTKHGNTGLGLWKIREILRKDNSFELKTSKDDYMFKQELEIYSC